MISFDGPMEFLTMDVDMAAQGRTAAFGAADAMTSPKSLLIGFAVADDRVAARAMAPVGRLGGMRGPLPPGPIRHRDADRLMSDRQAGRLREAWLKAHPAADADHARVPGAGHGGAAFDTDEVIGPMLAFLARVLG